MLSCGSRHCGFSFAINFQALFDVQGKVSLIGHNTGNTLFFSIFYEILLFPQPCSSCPPFG
jgi:hypothetical protein